jgi:hypothetical protein
MAQRPAKPTPNPPPNKTERLGATFNIRDRDVHVHSLAWVIIARDRPHIKSVGLHWPLKRNSQAGEMILPERTTLTTITFLRPFSLTDVDGVQPAGNYTVETIDKTLDNLSFIAYRRVSTSIMLPAIGAAARQRQVIFIDPLELKAALKRDAQL